MYHPTTRVLTVLELLQSHDQLTGAELARRLEVDPRSIRRYITMLQDLGIPIEGTRGRYGSYRVRPGFKLPPLLFTEDEAVALTLGLLTTRHLGVHLNPTTVEGTLAKVQRVLPLTVRERIQAVQTHIVLDPPARGAALDSSLVVLMSTAAHQAQQVEVRYQSQQGADTERVLEPYGVVCWDHYWYVVGYCHLRRAVRMFRLDRVAAVTLLPATFVPPATFDCLDYVIHSLATMPGAWRIEVELGITLHDAQRVVPPAYALLEPSPHGVLFHCHFDDLDQMARYLVSLGCRFVVRQPMELQEALQRLAQTITDMASASA